jgi:hypothetical protein
MRKNLLIMAVLLCFVAAAAFAHHGPANITIDVAKAKQPGVPFTHGKHATTYVAKCETCHHTDKGLTKDTDKNVKKCSSCHMEATGSLGTIKDASLTKNPYHASCIGCHKTEKKGPTLCKDCHKK